MKQEEIQEGVKKEKLHIIKKENSEMRISLAMEDLIDHQEMERKKVLVIKENLVLEINQNLLVKEDLIDHQEMERKKVLVIKENLVLEINQNLLVKEDLIDHQEMERKKVLVIKENLVLEINQNLLVKGRPDRSSRDGEKKSFGYKGKSSFTKKDHSKPTGFTNNPKYFGQKSSEGSSTGGEKKSFGFGGKKKFKSRSSRPKNFTFKKHSQKRAKV